MVNAQTKTIDLIQIGDCIVSSVAIVYFSGYGHTAKQAEAVRKNAASVEDAKVKIYRISETGDLPEGAFEEIGAAHAIIYGSRPI
jgi:NAD(P)H dehydrogenase (quinone)